MTLSTNQILGLIDGIAPVGAESEMETRAYKTYVKALTDGGTAGTDALISPVVALSSTEFPNGAKVIEIRFTPSVAVTGDNTNNKVVTATSLTSAGASSVTIGALTTSVATGNFVANQSKALTLTAANTIVPVGGSVLITMTHGGTGVAIASATGAGLISVTLQAL
jgi:hypothetical protein